MILVTGGCGYIGSHFVIKLLEKEKEVLVIDNFSNSSREIIKKMNQIKNISNIFIEGDIRDKNLLEKIFSENKIGTVAHFAGLKSIVESIERPIAYYSSNVFGSICLFDSMKKANINNLIFSSSATVYGNNYALPWNENLHLGIPKNPYAKSKLFVENILKDISKHDKNWGIGVLRYFNPIGSHNSGIIGENIVNEEGNLIPSIIRVLLGKSSHLNIYGDDYNTSDGTGVRDYIHVNDLTDGHIRALDYIKKNRGFNIWNLGSGKGYSVFEIIKTFEDIIGRKIPYKIKKRRKGDLSEYWADVTKANRELKWKAQSDLKKMVKDTLNYIDRHNSKI